MRPSPIVPLALLALLLTTPAPGQEEAPEAAPLSIVAVEVEPESPGADTLCKLRIRIRNEGEEIASQLGFTVRLNGQTLGVYGNQLFMFPVAPGETAEIPLYNFWTTESSRGMPADGKLRVEVDLNEARWMKVQMEDDVEVWTPIGDVDGLPVTASTTLTMSR